MKARETTASHELLFVFTPKGADRIQADAAVGPFVFDQRRARRCSYVVCVQNRERPGQGQRAEHGAAFLVGRVSDIVKSPEQPEHGPTRWDIQISAAAPINIAHAWQGSKNPVRYVSAAAADIPIDRLKFQNVSTVYEYTSQRLTHDTPSPTLAAVADAKRQIADALGVPVERVRVSIEL